MAKNVEMLPLIWLDDDLLTDTAKSFPRHFKNSVQGLRAKAVLAACLLTDDSPMSHSQAH
ncbi:uncharacterized protein FTOL_02433 [Fusarium torulosum]|uniref:Uncharacterized protein n=1 Tax=Fusarium torulosum TaxID=33205 RepID=A0AAE8SEU0_9HYPO|nr:uncharacterized protein FTOL_02433 [Fusarium torulosum]